MTRRRHVEGTKIVGTGSGVDGFHSSGDLYKEAVVSSQL